MSDALQTDGGSIPQWDLADRMRKALRQADVSVREMSEVLDVGRNTVSRYINGHHPPTTATLRVWAMRCGVPFSWLKDGTEAPDGPPDQGERTSMAMFDFAAHRARKAAHSSRRAMDLTSGRRQAA